jgi:16S rRNA (cytidine1402-2'-O)-methyltransferase
MDEDGGKLTLVATPIGNLGDLSPRCVEALSKADFWIVEDSRVSGKLQSHLSLKKPMRVFNEHSSLAQAQRYVDEISAGAKAVLLTDAGTPGISDPGAIVADLCHEAHVEVDAIPGPSAVMDALMLSGFFAQRFVFLGFLGRKPGSIRQDLAVFKDSPLTIVLFESPFRAEKLLQTAYEALGPRRFAVCRELTKLHQEVIRGTLGETLQGGSILAKGEFSIVIEGKRKIKSAE